MSLPYAPVVSGGLTNSAVEQPPRAFVRTQLFSFDLTTPGAPFGPLEKALGGQRDQGGATLDEEGGPQWAKAPRGHHFGSPSPRALLDREPVPTQDGPLSAGKQGLEA